MQPVQLSITASSKLYNLVNDYLRQWWQVLSNNISFGDPDNNSFFDNVAGVYVDVNFAAANVEQAIVHNLQEIPAGYLVVSKNVSCDVYQQKGTGTAWTNTTIYLKCTAIATVRLFILGH